jgi:hypothetical protein
MAAPKSSKQVPASGNRRPPNAGKGRPKGTPNKVSREAREVVAEFARGYAPKFVGWIDRVAVTDPARAAELYLRALEYHIPKLTRSHITASGMTLEELVMAAGQVRPEPQSDPRPAIEAAPTPSTTYQRVDPPAPAPAEPVAPQVQAAPPPAPAPQIDHDEYHRRLWDQIDGPRQTFARTDFDPYENS